MSIMDSFLIGEASNYDDLIEKKSKYTVQYSYKKSKPRARVLFQTLGVLA